VLLYIHDVESAMVTNLFVVSSVDSSSEFALESIGRSFRSWVSFIGGGCGEDSRVCELIVFESMGGFR
jgi:hypothetical protein